MNNNMDRAAEHLRKIEQLVDGIATSLDLIRDEVKKARSTLDSSKQVQSSELDKIERFLSLTPGEQAVADGMNPVWKPAVDALYSDLSPLKPFTPVPEPKLEEPLTINEEWQDVLERMYTGSEPLFITGNAGTGKSTLLKHFVQTYEGVTATVAPTGVAALRVGGQTIHGFFKFGPHAQMKGDARTLDDYMARKYRCLNALIIDEVSMVRADLMDAIEEFMRKNGPRKDEFFGGVPVLMFGDPYQLPPVSSNKDERKYLLDRYGTETPYFFHAECWKDHPIKSVQLTTTFRQKDPVFTSALNAIRIGNVTGETLQVLNARVSRDFVPPEDEAWVTLTTTNVNVDNANREMLLRLNTERRQFDAQIDGKFDLKSAPTDANLVLKVGARVMFVRNSADHYWVNGTLGIVHSVNPLEVDIDGLIYPVGIEEWESIEYTFDAKSKRLTKSIVGKFSQVPLRLAAAITIHKSQGLTLDRVFIDFASGAFAAGQAYVALSRARTLEGLKLRRPVRTDDLIVSSEVRNFMTGQPILRPVVIEQMDMLGSNLETNFGAISPTDTGDSYVL